MGKILLYVHFKTYKMKTILKTAVSILTEESKEDDLNFSIPYLSRFVSIAAFLVGLFGLMFPILGDRIIALMLIEIGVLIQLFMICILAREKMSNNKSQYSLSQIRTVYRFCSILCFVLSTSIIVEMIYVNIAL